MRNNDEIIALIFKLLEENDMSMSELARRVDMAKSAVSRYLNKTREFPLNRASDFAEALGVSTEDFLGVSPLTDIANIYNQLVPPRQEKVYQFAEHQLEQQQLEEDSELYVVGQTAAGEPLTGQQAVPFVGATTLLLYVNGDSMEPDFYNGDIVEYKPQPTLENGEIGVFAVNGGITMKRFKTNGEVRLQSLNDKYEDIVITEEMDFNILGKVVI